MVDGSAATDPTEEWDVVAVEELGICFVPGVLRSADHDGGAIAPHEDGRFFLPQRVEQIAFEGQVMERVVAGQAP